MSQHIFKGHGAPSFAPEFLAAHYVDLDTNQTYIAGGTSSPGDWQMSNAPVQSVFGRADDVVAANGDYTASQITNVPSGGIVAVTVQAAIDELDSEKQDASALGSAAFQPSSAFDAAGSASAVQSNLNSHTGNTSNPHSVTKTQVGLSNVPNIDATNPSNIVEDVTHRFTTDTEKSTWNAKEPAIAAGTTAQYWRGDKSWQSFLDAVLSSVLTGLSLATGTAITAADSILVAFGKLQKQISDNLTTLSNHISNTSNPHSTTYTQVGADASGSAAAAQAYSIQRSNHTGTQTASTITDFASTVLSTVLTGLSLATSTAVTAADSILVAIGKLQAQVTLRALASRLVSTGYGLTGGGDLSADRTHAVSLTNSSVSATADTTVNNTSFELMASMTITPAAGTYLAVFGTSLLNSGNGADRTRVALYVGGTIVSETERYIGTGGGANSNVSISYPVAVNGSQAIEIYWRVVTAATTSTAHMRSLSLVRIA